MQLFRLQALIAMRMRAMLLILMLTLNGCTTWQQRSSQNTPPPTRPDTGINHPLFDHSWILEGKLSIKHNGKRETAFIRWHQKKQQLKISLSGAMGQGLTQVLYQPNVGATLISKHEKQIYPDLDSLFYEHMGWLFPVERVIFWVTGRPDPNDAFNSKDNSGKLNQFEQANWSINIKTWQTLENTSFEAPRKLTLSYPASSIAPELNLILVIKKWQSNPKQTLL